jgi:membrane-associated phospholipid phosphatase
MSAQSVWNLVTNFGDSAVGLPIALLVLIALLASGWSRGAAGWFMAVAACGLVMLTFKLAFNLALEGCGPVTAGAPHFSPSGHAALSTVIYGGLAILVSRHLPELAQFLIAIAASAWVCAIAASRIELHAHGPLEVAAGLAVGATGVIVLAATIGRSTGPRWLMPVLAVITVAVIFVMHGTRWPVEENLHAFAVWLRGSAGLCGR